MRHGRFSCTPNCWPLRALEQDLSAADPALLSFYLAGSLPLDLDLSRNLLSLRSEAERLSSLITYLENHHSQSSSRRTCPRKGRRQRPCSLKPSRIEALTCTSVSLGIKGFTKFNANRKAEAPTAYNPEKYFPGVPHESSTHARRIAPQSIFPGTSAHPPRERRTPAITSSPACARHDDSTIFPGIVGYEDTVVPQIVNAILSRHNFILLGLRGQAKSRILRALTTLLIRIRPTLPAARFVTIPTLHLPPLPRRGRAPRR